MTRTIGSALAALLLVQAPATLASAEDALGLYVDPTLDAEAVRSGLATDLGYDVELTAPGAARLSIILHETGAEVAYAGHDGTRVRRVALPADDAEHTVILVLIAANLARDPTEQLVDAPIETHVQAEAERSAPTPTETGSSFAERDPFRFGVGLLAGAASTPPGVTGYWYLGVDLMGTVHPNLSIGITRLSIGLGFSSSETFIFGLQGTPTLEVFAFVDPHVQVYGQLGVALQGRQRTAFREGYFQVAPSVGGGVRFWATDWLSIGPEIGLHIVATDAFLMGDVALPQGSVAGSGALNVGFHF